VNSHWWLAVAADKAQWSVSGQLAWFNWPYSIHVRTE